jgi:ADP-heptose:LPS heptosyltransferase
VPRKVLLIRLRLIGDVILTTPAVRAVRRLIPDVHLTYLVEPHAAAAVAGNPHLDTVIVAPLATGLARLHADARLAWRLRQARYDAVLDFHGGPRSSFLAWASGAPRRIGYDVSGRSWMYTERVHRPKAHRERHSVENQWDLIAALLPGLAQPSPATDPVEMPEAPAARVRVRTRLAGLGGGASGDLVVVHVGAGNEFRRWPESAFASLVEALILGAPDRRIILTTGTAQAPTAVAIKRAAIAHGVPADVVGVWCDLGLDELRSLIGCAQLFIGGDSGPAHIAATTTVPMVVLYGPTTPGVWGPWRSPALATEIVDAGALPCRPCDQHRCEPGDFRCLRWITPDAVMAAATRALARESARTRADA